MEEDSLNLPLDYFQAQSPPPSSPVASVGLRKSINWARPVATSMRKSCVKRIITRLSGTSFSSTDPCSASIEVDKSCKEVGQYSDEDTPVRVISYGTRRCGRQHKALEASPTEPQESNCLSMQAEPESQTQKRARIIQVGEPDQLDRNVDIQAEKEWIPVPLDGMEEEKNSCKTHDCMNFKAKDSPLRRSDNVDATKTTEDDHRNHAFCSFNTVWQGNPKRHKTKSAGESKHDTAYESVCKVLVQFKKVVHNVENLINELQEDQMKAIREENRWITDMAALKRERLRNEISELSQKNSRILDDKLAIERDMDYLQKDLSHKVERSLESLRSELEREHAETVAGLTKELSKEQDKTICQICFTKTRDTIILPCTHFQYCSECLRELKECPTCRTKVNGALSCNLCTN